MRRVNNPCNGTLKQRRFYERHQHPCIDCGRPCSFLAIRCKSCAAKKLNAPRKKDAHCIDCGIGIRRSRNQPQRCKACYSKHNKGANHPNWKGGRRKSQEGYVLIWKPDHPRAIRNLVLEHILVLEQKLGRPLKKGEVGHHLNGIKDDNRPNNLVTLSSQKHYLVLDAKAKRIQELEALLRQQGQLI